LSKEKRIHHNLKSLVVGITVGLSVVLISIAIPFVGLGGQHVDFNEEVNATMINGILTGTALIFGFVTFFLRRVGRTFFKKLALILPLIVSFAWTVEIYFIDSIKYGYATKNTMFAATANFFLNIIWYGFVLLLMAILSHDEPLTS
jgi:hypothetical protein